MDCIVVLVCEYTDARGDGMVSMRKGLRKKSAIAEAVAS
jgi:hypothetical protein